MKKKYYRNILYYLLSLFKNILYYIPYRAGFAFVSFLGRITFHVLAKERKKTLGHLRTGFGSEKTEEEIQKIGEAVFEHYARSVFELSKIEKIIPEFDKWVSAEGYENFDKGLEKRKGIIAVIAHFGNWEIMGGYSAHRGYPCTVIAKKIYFEKFNNLLVSIRKKLNLEIIYRDSSAKSMLSVLRKNRILGFVVDQDIDSVEGVFVNFFNRPAFTPSAPVRFSMISGAPIIPIFCVREGIKHHVIVESPIELVSTDDKEADLQTNTQKWVAVQEKYIRRYPHLWVWNHRRWKTQTVGQ
jgi:KDO2-lipid IV(A) lauroyltransferase